MEKDLPELPPPPTVDDNRPDPNEWIEHRREENGATVITWRRRGDRPSPREAGRSLGAGFGRLSGSDAQRSEGMAQAMADGFRNARERDAETRELTNDPDWLRQCGFYGRSEDDL